MKNQISLKIKFILAAAVIALLSAGCDSLISPQKARTNPYDSMNPVPAAVDLNVSMNETDPENRFSEISWADGTSDTDTTVDGYVVYRKTGSASENIWDGSVIAIIGNSEAKSAADYDFTPGTRNYYSVYTYGTSVDLESDQQLFIDDNNNIGNFSNYDFTGPVTGSTAPREYVDLEVIGDAEFFDGGSLNEGSNFITASRDAVDPGGLNSMGFIKWDLSSLPEGNIKYASLVLTNNGSSSTGSVVLAPLKFPWDDVSANWSSLTASDAVDSDYEVFFEIINTADGEINAVNLADICIAWTDGSVDNNGLRVYPENEAPVKNYIFSSVEGPNSPMLRIMLFDE